MCVQILHRLIKYLVCYNYSTFRRFRRVDIHMNQAAVNGSQMVNNRC